MLRHLVFGVFDNKIMPIWHESANLRGRRKWGEVSGGGCFVRK